MLKRILIFLFLLVVSPTPVMAVPLLKELTVINNNSIQINITTENNTVEEKVRIVLPDNYVTNGELLLNTDNLLSGASPLLIDKTKNVEINGRVIEIPINNLDKNTKYGFKIIGGITKNDSNNRPWRIALIADGVENCYQSAIESISNNLTITAKTVPRISDYVTRLTSSNDTNLPVDHEVEFTVFYGSNLPYDDNSSINLIVEWDDENGLGVWNYVLDSATEAYGNSQPIVDLINKTITWQINDLPKQKNDWSVKFKLKSYGQYRGVDTINASVASRIVKDKLSTVDSLLMFKYKYGTFDVNPGSSNNNNGGSSSSVPVATTPVITPVVAKNKITNVELNSVNDQSAIIKIDTSGQAMIRVHFGTEKEKLNKELILLTDENKQAWLDIPNLEAGKIYYIKIDGIRDVFSFKSAEKSEKSAYESGSLIVSSQNNVVLASKTGKVDESAVLVSDQEYSVRLSLDKVTAIKEAKVYVKNKRILGTETDEKILVDSDFVRLLEYESGVFVGKLLTPKETGEYEFYLRLVDFNGNISEKKIGQLKVEVPMLVIDKDGNGIEKAKVRLFVLNQLNNIYEEIKPTMMSIRNPVFSESDGKVMVVLPKGKYKAEIESIGFVDKEVLFEIGWNNEQQYPKIILDKKPWSLGDVNKYFKEIKNDFMEHTNTYIDKLAASNRFFYLIMVVIIATLIGLSLLSLSFRIQVPVWLLPIWAWMVLKKNILGHYKKVEEINITDEESGWPISRARLFVIDESKNKILAKTYTDKLGKAIINRPKSEMVKLQVFKKGWEETKEMTYSLKALEMGGVRIELRKSIENTIGKSVKLLLVGMLERLMEVLMLGVIILEILFVNKFGVLRAGPFLVVSIINLLIWLIFVYKMSRKKGFYEKVV